MNYIYILFEWKCEVDVTNISKKLIKLYTTDTPHLLLSNS